MKKRLRQLLALLLTAFALLTLFLSSSVIFDLFGIRSREGNFVPFVVWANFLCSLAYLAAAYGLFRQTRRPHRLLLAAAGLLALAFIGLLLHINAGGLYETKTVFALLFRTAVTLAFAGGAYWVVKEHLTNGEKNHRA
jgi:drug/metabolite transporter (DMT)-like permease